MRPLADELVMMASVGHLDGMAEMLEGMNPNTRNRHGVTALYASINGLFDYPEAKPEFFEIVALLMKHGADPDLGLLNGWSPRRHAAYLGTYEPVMRELADLMERERHAYLLRKSVAGAAPKMKARRL